ncbi:MAG: patatin-like phospholipase family protein [Elusimicrobia bacterium]|nr:patatin-like phospholipase family protein [Elusimicrobiota bacterium]
MNPEELPTWTPFLKRALLFRDLSSEDLDKVAARLKPLSLPKGATLYTRGDAGDAFYLVTSGQVRLLSERGGREVITAFLGRGDALGELSLLTGEPRSVTVKLDTTSEFLVLSKKEFEEIVRENPTILIHLSRIIAQRLLHTTKTHAPAQPKSQQQLLVWASALEESARVLFMVHVALNLVEESRKRILLVDMTPNAGALAKAMGMRPVLTNESMFREQDLRDPGVLRNLVSEHPSGLSVMSLPPSVLGGRLYRGIFLLMNLLRDNNDFVLIAIGDQLGDVERSILEEADAWGVVGSTPRLDAFHKLESSLSTLGEGSRKVLRIWLGDLPPTETAWLRRSELFRVPWSQDLCSEYERGISAFSAMERFPHSMRALRRLARRFAGLSIGLAMGSGAALGYSLIGVLKGLRRANIEVDMVSGTSIGSLIAGYYALGMDIEAIEKIALGVDKAWVYENLFWDLTLPRAGIFGGVTLHRFIKSYFGDKEFHELEIPFACVATDIETGEGVVLREGRVADAIRASCGIPLLFAPYHHQGRFLVDGGLVDPVPVRVVSQMGADLLISINLTMPAAQRKSAVRERRSTAFSQLANLQAIKDLAISEALQAPNMLEILFQMIYTMEYEISQSRVGVADVVIQPELGAFSWTELHRAREIIEMGERAAEESVPKIKAMLPYFANYCVMPMKPWKAF